MLVSSFGYLNKGLSPLNSGRVEGNKVQKPFVNQEFSSESKQDVKPAEAPSKSESVAKHINVIA